jgi:hypothetical protein
MPPCSDRPSRQAFTRAGANQLVFGPRFRTPMTASALDNRSGPAPELSVIVPLEDARGQAEACVRRLVSEQTLDRDRYEVIVPMPGEDPEAEARVRGLLDGERDRTIRHTSTNRYLLFNVGAEQARGEKLFFIEAHCVAEPGCLEKTLAFLEQNGYVGASCQSISWSETTVGGYEEELFGHSLAWVTEPDHWYKVLIHGFAVEREAFDAVGGFDHHLGNLSDVALAATFEQGGYELGYAPEAIVNHFYKGDLRPTFEYLRNENHGEMDFRAEHPASYFTRYVPDAYEWKDRGTDRATARRLRREALRALRSRGIPLRLRLTLAWVVAGRCGRPALGGRLRLGRAWAALAARWAVLAARIGLGRPSYAGYLRWWQAATRFSRLERLIPDGVPTRPWDAARGPLELGGADDRPLSGFHLVEELSGRRFRWGGPLAAIELELVPDTYRIQVDLLPVRDAQRDREIAALFDGNLIRNDAITRGPERISFGIDPGLFDPSRDSHSLTLACTPVPRRSRLRDKRPLGLPVWAVTVETEAPSSADPSPPDETEVPAPVA